MKPTGQIPFMINGTPFMMGGGMGMNQSQMGALQGVQGIPQLIQGPNGQTIMMMPMNPQSMQQIQHIQAQNQGQSQNNSAAGQQQQTMQMISNGMPMGVMMAGGQPGNGFPSGMQGMMMQGMPFGQGQGQGQMIMMPDGSVMMAGNKPQGMQMGVSPGMGGVPMQVMTPQGLQALQQMQASQAANQQLSAQQQQQHQQNS